MFRIDAASGLIEFLGTEPTRGRTPRFFALGPQGHRLYALNEESDTIVVFAVETSGRLAATGTVIDSGSPVCMVFSAGTV
jgi:6-phosphogluconolactonase (cycloisomerase 2 family)